MFAKYLKETKEYETLETEDGIFTYRIYPVSHILDIGDMYVKPDKRTGLAFKKMYDKIGEIGIANKCDKVTCNVETYQTNPERAMYMMLRNRFKYSHFNNGVIYFYRKLME